MLGAALVAAVGLAMPLPGSAAADEADRIALLAPGLGCGPAEAAIGTLTLYRVRASRSAPPRRAPGEARRPGRAEKPGLAEEEMPAVFLHAFYTCAGTQSVTASRVGGGRRATGPVRRS